jgi:hypothetical protein
MLGKELEYNYKDSATGSLRYFELKTISHGLMMSAQNYQIKGSRVNCNGCRIHAKQMEINRTM